MNCKEYLELLAERFQHDQKCERYDSRLEFLSSEVFGFTTYDSAIDEIFASKACEVCDAITNRVTFEYIGADAENYKWFLIMCNMPFFSKRIEWGTSVRGAWWEVEYNQSGELFFWNSKTEEYSLKFDNSSWIEFVKAVVLFSKER